MALPHGQGDLDTVAGQKKTGCSFVRLSAYCDANLTASAGFPSLIVKCDLLFLEG